MLLQRHVIANVLQSEAWLKPLMSNVDATRVHLRAAAVAHLLADGQRPDGHAPVVCRNLKLNPRRLSAAGHITAQLSGDTMMAVA